MVPQIPCTARGGYYGCPAIPSLLKMQRELSVTSGKQPGPDWAPSARLVLRLGWQPMPVCPTQEPDDDRPERPQAPG